MRRTFIFAVVAALALLGYRDALAEDFEKAYEACHSHVGTKDLTNDDIIAACSIVLKSGYSDEYSGSYSNRGSAYCRKGDYEHGIADYTAALKMRRFDNGYLFFNRAGCYADKGDYTHAIVDYNEAIQREPREARYIRARASAYQHAGDYDHALADYDQALNLEPGNAGALNGRCFTRAVAGRDLPAALADCTDALRSQPTDSNILDSRGLVYFRMGQWDNAIADFDAALKGDPTLASSLYVRGLAKRRKGDAAGAAADIAAAKAINPQIDQAITQLGVTA